MKAYEILDISEYYERQFSRYKPNKAVHYCNTDTFYKIVEPYINDESLPRSSGGKTYKAKCIRFFASDMLFLNDQEERRIGKTLVNRVVSSEVGIEIAETEEEMFIACFCNDTDNLTQWKHYGKDCGLAVEFDMKDVVMNYCETCCCGKDVVKYPKRHDLAFAPYNVFYCNPSEDKFTYNKERLLSMLPSEAKLTSIAKKTAELSVIPYIKHDAFRDEKESRIILYHSQSDNGVCSLTKYRSGSVFKPYLEMRLFYDSTKAEKKIPIKSVTIGPASNQDLVFRSVYHILERNPMLMNRDVSKLNFITTSEGIKIIKSKIPFRS